MTTGTQARSTPGPRPGATSTACPPDVGSTSRTRPWTGTSCTAPDNTALRLVADDETVTAVSYADLAGLTAAFANMLDTLEVRRGEVVFSLLGRDLDTFVAALGTLKHGLSSARCSPAFGPEPIRQRLLLGHGRVLVTTAELYRRRVAAVRAGLRDLEHVLLVDAEPGEVPGTLAPPVARRSPPTPTRSRRPTRRSLPCSTSPAVRRGPRRALCTCTRPWWRTTPRRPTPWVSGRPMFWCTADPGWVTGTSYGIIAPLTHGATVVCDAGEFKAKRWYRILEQQRVTVWYTAPTALRMLMRAGADGRGLRPVRTAAHRQRRRAAEPGGRGLGAGDLRASGPRQLVADRDRGDHDRQPARPARASRLDGVAPAGRGGDDPRARRERRVLVDDCEVCEVGPGGTGSSRCGPGGASMFRTYLGEEARYQRCFVGGWYLTGDLARRDEDGYFWFVGRGDDVIKSAHLIGPFEVESALMEHPAVAEAG